MRINHKSDFDFRLDLYAADPYGTAVASGFPACDFSGKLFIGPSARNRQFYPFSKSGDSLVNCFNTDGHLHVVVSGHKLGTGPLFCELTLQLPDSRYPNGIRSVVYNFPLSIYLTDSDAEHISPTVSVTLPVIAAQAADSGNLDNASDNEEVVPSVKRLTSRFSEPWLSPRVCGGTIRTGSYVGNIYHNRGRINISGEIVGNVNGFELVKRANISSILKLGIPNLTKENLLDNVFFYSDKSVSYYKWTDDNYLYLASSSSTKHMGAFIYYHLLPKAYNKNNYVAIGNDGKIKILTNSPVPEYKIKPPSIESIKKLVSTNGAGLNEFFFGKKSHHFMIQIFRVIKREKSHTKFKIPTVRFKNWQKINTVKLKTYLHLKFRIATRLHHRRSEWVYFAFDCDYKPYIIYNNQ